MGYCFADIPASLDKIFCWNLDMKTSALSSSQNKEMLILQQQVEELQADNSTLVDNVSNIYRKILILVVGVFFAWRQQMSGSGWKGRMTER